MNTQKQIFGYVSMIVSVAAMLCTSSLQAAVDSDKVSPWVLNKSAASTTVPVLIRLNQQLDHRSLGHSGNALQRRTRLVEALQQTASEGQNRLIGVLKEENISYRSFWIVNMISAELTAAQIDTVSQHADVAFIHANPTVKADLPQPEPFELTVTRAVEASISLVGADQLWSQGITGQNIVIGGQDTGYQWDHPALINSYRGFNGMVADHNYNWHDAIHSGGGVCGADSVTPCDDHNHGTHTMGTMVGDDGGSNQIGMAPGARWIGCRNMDQGNGTPATYAECFQWFIAPTDLNGENPDPAQAPHVINNSWGCPASEGCTDPAVLQGVVENVRAAGIVVVVSAGNSGSSCSSVNTPAAIYDASFTVGNTRIDDTISFSSSRGPVTVDGSQRMKPDISAPGTSIRSSIRNNAYASFSGTSMAGPHVAGHMALIMSAQPSLIGNVDQLEQITRDTALQLTSNQNCGFAGQSPNNVFGYGRIDSVAAVAQASTALFSDGFE